MKYLVTGATGFIGPYLIDRLVSSGHECRVLVRPGSEKKLEDRAGVERFAGDVTKPKTLKGLAEGMDRVLHLATLGHMSNYTVTPSMFEAINVRGAINVMREALRSGVERVVHTSSVAAMGICDEVPADEDSECKPHHAYGRSKLEAEKRISQMVRGGGLPACIVRFSMVYGPGDRRDMLKLARMARRGMLPKVGKRPKLTPLIHAKDAVEGLLLACEKGKTGEIYLITNKKSEPFDKIVSIVKDAMGDKKPVLYVPEKPALMVAAIIEKAFSFVGKAPPVTRKMMESTLADRVFSIEKARMQLGFAPGIEPEKGLRETVKWYQSRGWI